jgi:F-box-like
VTSIDILPDEVLLPIFDFYVDEAPIHAWHSLVHVCRRWRSIVFGSPRRLDLRLFCTAKTPTRDALDVWPSLPLLIRVDDYQTLAEDVDNVVAVLERRDRVCLIGLWGLTSPLEKVLAVMQEPFPELVDLVLESSDGTVPVFPDSFLGGSTPRLQSLWLDRIPFPGLPNLLLSATHLVNLHLLNVPPSGYISPEVMVTALSTLTSLETLKLELQSPRSHPGSTSRHSPSPTHTILPVLIQFWFQGDSKYLEDLVARIDTPQLDFFYIAFYDQIVFDTIQFIQFINRTPTLKTLDRACVVFENTSAIVNFSSQTFGYRELDVRITCSDFNWELLSLERVFASSLPPLSTSEDLYISEAAHSQPDWLDAIGTVWLDILCPFTAVKNLYLSKQVACQSCKGSLGTGRQRCFPTCRIFSWRSSGHRDVSRKALRSSLPCDRSPVTQ